MQDTQSTDKSQRPTPSETESVPRLLSGMFGLVCISVSSLFPSHSPTRELLMLVGSILFAARYFRTYLFPALALAPIEIAIDALHPIRGWAGLLLIVPMPLVFVFLWLRERAGQRRPPNPR